jgi:hypothetical protein
MQGGGMIEEEVVGTAVITISPILKSITKNSQYS